MPIKLFLDSVMMSADTGQSTRRAALAAAGLLVATPGLALFGSDELSYKRPVVSNCIYDITPISYLLTLVALKLKRFKEADSYIDDFTKCKYISNLTYYNYIKKYIQFRLNNASEKTIAQNLPENIIKDMRDENIFENMYLPPCPNCKECKISNFCLTKGIYRFQQCIDTYSKDICLKQNFTYHHV